MFSRYRKQPATAAKPAPEPDAAAPAPETRQSDEPAVRRRPAPRRAAQAAPADKEKKRKERLAEIKLELHRALLENLNLAALEHASEADLRAEINDIASEALQEKGIVLNREDRTTLNQELYDEVRGLGPLETLLQDDSVNDILVNGPQQIFVERNGQLELPTSPSRTSATSCASSTRS